MPRHDPTTDGPVRDAYVFERGVVFNNTALASQMQVMRTVVQSVGQFLTAAQMAAYLWGARPTQAHPLLDTLAALTLIHHLESETAYAA